MAVVARGGKPAPTNWERLGGTGAVSFLRLRLETGRTHQIRVHATTAMRFRSRGSRPIAPIQVPAEGSTSPHARAR